jgi:hypothetical protein
MHLVLFLSVYGICAQNDSSHQTDTIPLKSVLLVKGDSYLERAVGKIVIDSLTHQGYSVKTIRHNSLTSENSAAYYITIIFNGVKSSELIAPVREYVNSRGKAPSNALISTVYGEQWRKNKPTVDAVASATKTLDPELVAAKIIAYVDRNIERDTATAAPDSIK